MIFTKLAEPLKSASLAKGSPEDARYEMLASLIGIGQTKIEIDERSAEDLKCLLVGRWMEEDSETADIYAIKVFGSPVSSWSKKDIEFYKEEYKKNRRRYADVGVVMESAKRLYVLGKVLPVIAVAACAVGIYLKTRSKR